MVQGKSPPPKCQKTKWSLIGTYQILGKATEISITVNGEQLERELMSIKS